LFGWRFTLKKLIAFDIARSKLVGAGVGVGAGTGFNSSGTASRPHKTITLKTMIRTLFMVVYSPFIWLDGSFSLASDESISRARASTIMINQSAIISRIILFFVLATILRVTSCSASPRLGGVFLRSHDVQIFFQIRCHLRKSQWYMF
jgi:hypothetical protein